MENFRRLLFLIISILSIILPLSNSKSLSIDSRSIDSDCPHKMFKCLISMQKSNHIIPIFDEYFRSVGDFMCIEREKLCDGQQDCPEGQDESLEQCSNNELDEGLQLIFNY